MHRFFAPRQPQQVERGIRGGAAGGHTVNIIDLAPLKEGQKLLVIRAIDDGQKEI